MEPKLGDAVFMENAGECSFHLAKLIDSEFARSGPHLRFHGMLETAPHPSLLMYVLNVNEHDCRIRKVREFRYPEELQDEDETEPAFRCVSPFTVKCLLGERGWGLQDDVAGVIAKFLMIKTVRRHDVEVLRSSSTAGVFPLQSVFDPSPTNWWISDAMTMETGFGNEFLEFALSTKTDMRKMKFFSLRIPPTPQGPLSVRKFHFCWAREEEGPWLRHPRNFTTLDVQVLQEFVIDPPIEARFVRLHCTQCAGAPSPLANAVGLFEVRFS